MDMWYFACICAHAQSWREFAKCRFAHFPSFLSVHVDTYAISSKNGDFHRKCLQFECSASLVNKWIWLCASVHASMDARVQCTGACLSCQFAKTVSFFCGCEIFTEKLPLCRCCFHSHHQSTSPGYVGVLDNTCKISLTYVRYQSYCEPAVSL